MRHSLTKERYAALAAQIQRHEDALDIRAARRLKLLLEEEEIVHLPGETIYGWRTVSDFPDIYLPGEKEELHASHFIHEQGRVCNLSSDWAGVLQGGLLRRRGTGEARDITIDAVIAYADRYEDTELSEAVRYGAKDMKTALNMFRILHMCLWASNVYHNTIGRFDQYMYPFYEADIQSGRLTEQTALQLLQEFFLSFNRDSDMYTGMQQGDNGQSLMLGGCDREGRCAVNDLTYLCITASLNNRRIDPKINLRVDKHTPLSLYRRCTELTRQGLGFPQYSNDDVVIPALTRLGYQLEDARDYTVAACWEFIIPGVGMDIPNIGAVCLATVVHDVIEKKLAQCCAFDELMEAVGQELVDRADKLEASLRPIFIEPAPYQSVLMSDWSHDISEGAKYNNYGIHGTGFATAVDQLCSVRWLIFEKKLRTPQQLLSALQNNFENEVELKNLLLTRAPKLGRDASCESVADALLEAFAHSWSHRTNERGGCFRPGTGSAMYYWWHGRELGATCDGRSAGQMLSANFSPTLQLRDAGPLSVISAMTRPGLLKVCNGGPLTLELDDTVFKNAEGMEKVAMLVRSFIQMGGHQMQLNAVNRETLLDAQKNPQDHQDLIVRVWGWSGHFVQLDKGYQDQIIQRTSYREA